MSSTAWLVTGASGFLGRNVVQTLHGASSEHKIIAAGRLKGSKGVAKIEQHELDLSSSELELPTGIDTVLHLAGEKREESRMDAVNHQGTRRLVEAAARASVRRFVYVSSVGVYGAPPHSGCVNEAFPHTPRNRYEVSKEAGEACVREICADSSMDSVILQPSNVIGRIPGQAHPLLGLMKMVRSGYFTWFGRAEPWANYVAVEDVAAAIVAAAERAPGGTYIINTPAPLSHVVGWIADEQGVEPPHRRLPVGIGQAAATFGSAVHRLTGRSMPINRERFGESTNTTQYDPTKLMKAAKFEYSLGTEALIRGLVRAYRREGLL